jgi:hypothetical protein
MADVSAARLQTNEVVDSATVLWFSAPVAAIIPLPDVSAILLGGDSGISKDSDGSVSPSSVLFYVSHSPGLVTDSLLSIGLVPATAPIDTDSHAVLISESHVNRLGFRLRSPPSLMKVDLALPLNNLEPTRPEFTEWVKLKPHNVNNFWSS